MIYRKNNSGGEWALFLFLPIAAYLRAFRNVFNKDNQKVILAFSFFYGFTVFLSGGDIIRYEQSFAEVIYYDWNTYWYFLTNLFSDGNHIYSSNVVNIKPDIFALSLQFLVSRFTDNPRWFWAILSVIYTFLTLSFINEIKKEINLSQKSFALRVFLIGILLIVPFYVGVTGVRFWTALYFFLIFAMRFTRSKKIKYLILSSFSLLFHYTFFIPVLLLFISPFVPKKKIFYNVLLIVGIVFAFSSSVSNSFNAINSFISPLEDSRIVSNATVYTDVDLLNNRVESLNKNNWYVSLSSNGMLYFLLILGIMDLFGVFKFKETLFLKKSYPLLFLFLILTLVTLNMGSLSRFKYVYFLLLLSRFVILAGLQPENKKMKAITKIFVPFLALYILVTFRAGFYFVDPLLLINNSLTMFFLNSDISLSEFIVGH
jgi:hypothetical protein